MAKGKGGPVYVFNVALKRNKKCWRRIALQGKQTLDDLHEAIFEAFDREDEHLYSFYLPQPGARSRARIRDAVEYTHPYHFEDGDFGEEEVQNAAQTAIDSLGLRRGQTLHYLFDFGDEWWHEITVEEIDGEPEKVRYPHILEKQGKSPPQYPDLDEDDL